MLQLIPAACTLHCTLRSTNHSIRKDNSLRTLHLDNAAYITACIIWRDPNINWTKWFDSSAKGRQPLKITSPLLVVCKLHVNCWRVLPIIRENLRFAASWYAAWSEIMEWSFGINSGNFWTISCINSAVFTAFLQPVSTLDPKHIYWQFESKMPKFRIAVWLTSLSSTAEQVMLIQIR